MGGSQTHSEELAFERLVKMRKAWYPDLFFFGEYFWSSSYLEIFLGKSRSALQFSETIWITPKILAIFNINLKSIRSYLRRPNMYYEVGMSLVSITWDRKETLTTKHDN